MHLKRLQIAGFKSFAHKTDLTFTRGITAVVGPNGSGKSNIADAIRWVMGEQSIKTLRGKKSEDIIFSGSDKKSRLGMAEVSLELDNSDRKIPIDYAELMITRRIYRDGDSEYMVNNAKSKLADINLLLTKANFGHRTYSVIGQGMIDNFLIATPQERKEFFDEASGVKQYQIKKDQALAKLETVWENLKILKIKTDEMEPQLRLLTKQVKKLEKRKEIEKELLELKLNYYSSYWQEINREYGRHKNMVDSFSQEKNRLESLVKTLADKMSQITRENKPNETINRLRQEQEEWMEHKLELKEQAIKLRMAKTIIAPTSAGPVNLVNRQELAVWQKKLEQISWLHKKLTERMSEGSDMELLKKEIWNINKKIDGLMEIIKPYLGEPAKIIKASEQKLSAAEEQADRAAGEIEKKIGETDQKLIKLREEIKILTAADNQSRSGLWQSQQDYQKAQIEFNQINQRINEARVALARVETKRFDLNREIEYECQGSLNLIQTELESLSEADKLNRTNKINKLKNQMEVIGGIDPEIEAEYQTIKSRYNFLTAQISDMDHAMEALKKLVSDLEATIKKQMEKSFAEINQYFQKYFKALFNGGRAGLTLVKAKDLAEEEAAEAGADAADEVKIAINFFQEKSRRGVYAGIEVMATPPGKKLKSINALSGGERALTSIALICAIIPSNPAPFVVLDEVDAALDEANSIRFAQILNELTHKTQFILITHNRATMEKARLLYGVTMGDDGVSKLVGLKLEEAEKEKEIKV